jgi:N6-adenosine-specific RNA methylase IME4
MKYKTILADPPWLERGGGKIKRGADRHYPLMKTEAICDLGKPLQQYIEDDAHLYLWVTNNFIPDGLEVMNAWGFRYITCITWAKDKIGLGQYFRGQTEQLFFGVRGRGRAVQKTDPLTEKLHRGKTLLTAPRTKHSKKPPEARDLVEYVSEGPYLELFARERAPGWFIWGNELDNDIDLNADGVKKPCPNMLLPFLRF